MSLDVRKRHAPNGNGADGGAALQRWVMVGQQFGRGHWISIEFLTTYINIWYLCTIDLLEFTLFLIYMDILFNGRISQVTTLMTTLTTEIHFGIQAVKRNIYTVDVHMQTHIYRYNMI